MAKDKQSGAKGHGSKRAGAQNMAYKAQNRREANKRKRVLRHAKAQAKHAAKTVKTPRGTCRAQRRLTNPDVQARRLTWEHAS